MAKNLPYNKNGFTLVLVLTIIVILSILLHVLMGIENRDAKLVVKEHKEIQAELLLQSGKSHVEYQFRKHGPSYRTSFFENWVEPKKLSFQTKVNHYGAFALANVSGVWKSPELIKQKTFLVSQKVSGLPNLWVLDTVSQIKLAKGSLLRGEALVWGGKVEASTRFKIRYQGGPIQVSIKDSSSFLQKSNARYWGNVLSWYKESELKFVNSFEDSTSTCVHTSEDVLIIKAGKYEKCLFFAPTVIIKDSVELVQGIVTAKTIHLSGNGIFSSQFIALDTLNINLQRPQEKASHYVVLGQKKEGFIGLLNVERFKGLGNFFFMANGFDKEHKKPSIVIQKQANIKGVVLSESYVDHRGVLQGHLICKNLIAEEQGTIWQGFLLDGKILPTSEDLYMPPIFQKFSEYNLEEF